MLGRSLRALSSGTPVSAPVKAPRVFVTVYSRDTGSPSAASGSTSGFGSTEAPCTAIASDQSDVGASDVRRASTTISHTPGMGSVTVRLVAVPPAQPPPASGLKQFSDDVESTGMPVGS